MTLILSVLTDDYVLQASDRRATFVDPTTGVVSRHEDETNKAVVFDNQFTFAGTGFGAINQVQAADWLMAELAQPGDMSVRLPDRLDEVARLTQAYVGNLHIPPEDKRHAFVAVGWTPSDERTGAWRPAAYFVSNSRDEDGFWLSAARNDFAVQVESFEGYEGFALFPAGVRVDDRVLNPLRAEIGRCIDAGEPPACIGRALVAAIRQVADGDGYVGKGVMLNCLPRIAVLRGMFEKQLILIAGEPDPEAATFLYIPHDAPTPADLLGPNAAFSNGSQMSGFRSTGPLGETGFVLGYGEQPRAAVGQRVRAAPKLGRNDPCWCGSGKKFKKCHGP